MDLAGATIAVTGGASGLGEATGRRLHAQGAAIVVLDLNEAAGTALAAEFGERALFARTDVSQTVDLQAALDLAVDRFGRLDGLINCAGIAAGARTLSRSGPHDLDVFKKVIAINLIGTFDAARLAAERMARNEPNAAGERGVIVNTASIAAYEGQIGQAAYAASKAGVVGLTLTLARDLAGYGIRVCTIAPGTIETPMVGTLSDEVRETLARQVPFPSRPGHPEEYAMLVQQILENPYLNGETIRLDGALRMGPR